MKAKKRGWLFLAFSMLMLLSMGGTAAFFGDQISVVNRLKMGDVDISLKEYELVEGREIAYQNPKLVQPGDQISKIPRITNLAEPIYLRVMLQYQNPDNMPEGISEKNLSGISSKWIKRGGYYYYTEILEKNEAVDLFHELRVPEDWDNHSEGKQFSLRIRAEAVQAVHFSPDFNSQAPWGDQKIDLCVHEENDRILRKTEKISHKIEFQGEAHRLIRISDDFFSNFSTAMPGDLLKDSAVLSNTGSQSVTLFFRTEALKQTTDQEKLLQQLKLELRLNGTLLYAGALRSELLEKEHELAVLKPGEGGTLSFSVKIPEGLDNEFALSDTAVKWIFRVEEQENTLPDEENPEQTGIPYHAVEETKEEYRSDSVQTEDPTRTRLYLLLCLGSAGGIWICTAVRKKEGK